MAALVDANVFAGERAAQRNFDLDRLQAQVAVILQQRQHDCGTAVDRLGGPASARERTVDHEHLVTAAAADRGFHEADYGGHDRHDAENNEGDSDPLTKVAIAD